MAAIALEHDVQSWAYTLIHYHLIFFLKFASQLTNHLEIGNNLRAFQLTSQLQMMVPTVATISTPT
jgi:hypothetical protein